MSVVHAIVDSIGADIADVLEHTESEFGDPAKDTELIAVLQKVARPSRLSQKWLNWEMSISVSPHLRRGGGSAMSIPRGQWTLDLTGIWG